MKLAAVTGKEAIKALTKAGFAYSGRGGAELVDSCADMYRIY